MTLNGGTNTIYYNQALTVNAGGTLDLAGYVQYVGNLTSYNAGVNQAIAGGTITSSTGNGIFITNSTNNPGNFSGTITDSTAQGTGTGVLTFERAGTFTLNLLGPNTYTGATYLTGGTTTLKDYGTLWPARTPSTSTTPRWPSTTPAWWTWRTASAPRRRRPST